MSQKTDPRKQKAAVAKTKEKSLVSKAEELLMSQYMRSLISVSYTHLTLPTNREV